MCSVSLKSVLHGVLLATLIVCHTGALGEEFRTFTTDRVVGDVAVSAPAQEADAGPKAGNAYPMGTRIETGTESSFSASLSEKNTFSVDPNTAVKVIRSKQKGKDSAVCLQLGLGRVVMDLAKYPADQGFQVNTALGKYTVVGTAFSVSYAQEPPAKEIGILNVTRGEVVFESDNLEAAAITAGGELIVVRERGGGATHYQVTANGRPVLLTIAGNHRLILNADSTVEIGIDDVRASRLAAIAVTAGSATVGDETLGPAGGAVFIRHDSILTDDGAAQYLIAVEQAAVNANQLQVTGLTPAEIAQLIQAQQEAYTIIEQSGDVVLNQVYRPPYVITPTQPPTIEPQSPSGASLPPSSGGSGGKPYKDPCNFCKPKEDECTGICCTICRPTVPETPAPCGICKVPTSKNCDSGICGICRTR